MLTASYGLPLVMGVAAVLFVPRLLAVRLRSKKKTHFWPQFEVVGVPLGGRFPLFRWARGLLGSLTATQRNTQEGYMKFSKAPEPQPFALPTIWTGGAVVVLPPSLLGILNMPDSDIRAFEAQLETIQLPYMISDRNVYTNVIHFDVVRRHMVNSKDVASLAPSTAEEVSAAFKDCWGSDRVEWRTLNAWDACGLIITRAATRVLIGLPMCHDETLFEQARLFSDAVMAGTALINCLPPLIRPIIGPLVALRARYYQWRCLKILVPFVKARIQTWRLSKKGEGLQNDFLQWMIIKCDKEGPKQMDPVRLATRLLALNTMFIIGMAYVFAHCVLDIHCSSSRDEIVAGLRAECALVSANHNQNDGLMATKDAVDALYKADSTIRESMRVSDIAVTSLARDVVATGGIDLGNGVSLPKGTRIVFPTYAIHRDPVNYRGLDPLQFDAFRFSQDFGAEVHEEAPLNGDNLSQVTMERENVRLTSITPNFLAWGYGKHSCPGRWFASQTMKQALVYMIMNYEIEVIGELGGRKVLLNTMLPRTDIQMKVRRRA